MGFTQTITFLHSPNLSQEGVQNVNPDIIWFYTIHRLYGNSTYSFFLGI